MAPRTYAIGPADASLAEPRWLWRFDSAWLRDEAVRRNPGLLQPVPANQVAHRVRRALRSGEWRRVAPGVDALPDPPPGVRATAAPPPALDLPSGRPPPPRRHGRG